VADVYNTSQSDNRYLTQSSASTTYLTQSNGITAATASATYIPLSSPVTSFKNKIINGDFRIWQRGTSFSNPAGGTYNADRFFANYDGTGATRTVSRQAFTPGNAISGYEPEFFYRYNQSVAGTSGTFLNILQQRIEDVRTFAGQTVNISFWAKADASRSVGVVIGQYFGTGGSTTVYNSAATHNITTSWARYSATINVPSISGKTIGTGLVAFELVLNATPNTVCTIDIWGIQVEKGSLATEFEQRFIGDELRMCQRYYQVHSKWYTFWNTATTTSAGGVIFDLPFRSTPAIVSGTQSSVYRYGPGGQRSSTLLTFQDYGTQSAYVIVTDNGGTPFVTNQPSVHNIVGHFSAEL
jgi:hypothetical protein